MSHCKEPKCQYSENKNKCIKPNPYIEAIAWCKRNNITLDKCRYNYDKKDAQNKACDRYEERLAYIPPKKVKVCPPGKVLNPSTNRCNKIKPQKEPRVLKERKTEKESSKIFVVPPNTPMKISSSTDKKSSKYSDISESSIRLNVPPNSPKTSSSKIRIASSTDKTSSKYSDISIIPNVPPNTPKTKSLPKMSSSMFNKVFKRKQIVKSTAKYFKNKGKKQTSETKLKKDIIMDNKKPKHLKQKVFLKDIFDDDKNVKKEMSSMDVLPMISKSPKEISNLSKKIKQIREKNAVNKIKVFLIKNIIKRSENLDNRLKYYNYIQEYLKNTDYRVCLKNKQFVDKNGKVNDGYVMGDYLKLVKRIGTDSKYGVIFKTIANNVLLTLATKLMIIDKDNMLEAVLNHHVTEIVKHRLTKHFLIAYRTYECHNPDITVPVPKLIQNKNYYMTLNELANGDINNLVSNQVFLSNNEIVCNVALQCLLSIATFHSLKMTHNDAHYGNFLYHSTKNTSGYYQYLIYGKTYYIKNCGYNVMIYDFGFAKKMISNALSYNRMIQDYTRILYAFIIHEDKGWVDAYPRSFISVSRIIKQLKDNLFRFCVMPVKLSEEHVVKTIIDYYLSNNLTNAIICKDLPNGAEVLNKNDPYIITDNIYTYAKSKGITTLVPITKKKK